MLHQCRFLRHSVEETASSFDDGVFTDVVYLLSQKTCMLHEQSFCVCRYTLDSNVVLSDAVVVVSHKQVLFRLVIGQDSGKHWIQ